MSMGTKEAGDPCYFRREQLRCHCYREVRQIHEMTHTCRVLFLSPEDAKKRNTITRKHILKIKVAELKGARRKHTSSFFKIIKILSKSSMKADLMLNQPLQKKSVSKVAARHFHVLASSESRTALQLWTAEARLGSK